VKLKFGKFKGRKIEDCPINYLMWLTDNSIYNKLFSDPWDDKDKFKVPFDVEVAAREELTKRGYVRKGMRWERS
jgi:hypothetical protein